MRLLLILVALVSAFFVHAQDPIVDDIYRSNGEFVGADSDHKIMQICGMGLSQWKFEKSFAVPLCKAKANDAVSSAPQPKSPVQGHVLTNKTDITCKTVETFDKFINSCEQKFNFKHPLYSTQVSQAIVAYTSIVLKAEQLVRSYKCPPADNPYFYLGPVKRDPKDSEAMFCQRPYSECPEPTDQDSPAFSSQKVCYNNPNGTQCQLIPDKNGQTFAPASYGSREPDQCKDSGAEPPPPPCEGDDCNPPCEGDNCPPPPCEGDECTPPPPPCEGDDCTPPPPCQGDDCTPPPPPCEGDDCTPPPCEGDDCVPCEGDNCPPPPCEGDECPPCEGEECPPPPCEGDDCRISQGGKQGGFKELFKTEDVDKVKSQIEDQRSDNRDLYDQITSELEQTLDIDPHLSGGYESRTLNLYGQTIDISVSRFSSFYAALAAPLMLVATLSAIFILLRERND